MKKLLVVSIGIITAGLIISSTACQKKDDGGSGGTIAQTPPPPTTTNTPPPTTCNIPGASPSACNPNYYYQNGWTYSYTNNQLGLGYCGCPAGTIPVMNMGWGMGCAPMNYSVGTSSYSGWNYPASNTQVLNQPPSYYTVPTSYAPQNGGNCYPFAAQACNVSIAGSCGFNSVCVASAAGSTLGVCQYAATLEVNHINNNCHQNNWGGFYYWTCNF